MELTFRKATQEDHSSIVALLNKETTTLERNVISKIEKEEILVAFDSQAGKIAGCIVYHPLISGWVRINYLYVEKEYRGCGVARKLVEKLAEEVKDKVGLQVRVPSEDEALNFFWTKLGFLQAIPERRPYCRPYLTRRKLFDNSGSAIPLFYYSIPIYCWRSLCDVWQQKLASYPPFMKRIALFPYGQGNKSLMDAYQAGQLKFESVIYNNNFEAWKNFQSPYLYHAKLILARYAEGLEADWYVFPVPFFSLSTHPKRFATIKRESLRFFKAVYELLPYKEQLVMPIIGRNREEIIEMFEEYVELGIKNIGVRFAREVYAPNPPAEEILPEGILYTLRELERAFREKQIKLFVLDLHGPKQIIQLHLEGLVPYAIIDNSWWFRARQGYVFLPDGEHYLLSFKGLKKKLREKKVERYYAFKDLTGHYKDCPFCTPSSIARAAKGWLHLALHNVVVLEEILQAVGWQN